MTKRGKQPDRPKAKKPTSPLYKANNEGGYGNPPIKGQRVKGGPGGPGRPKGSGKSLERALTTVMKGDISLPDGKKVATSEAIAMRVRQLGLTGGVPALRLLMDLSAKYGHQEPLVEQACDDELPGWSSLTLDELNELDRLAAKIAGKDYVPAEMPHNPFELSMDPNHDGNYYTERTIEGITYRHCNIPHIPSEILEIENNAYFSAALPRRPGCYKPR